MAKKPAKARALKVFRTAIGFHDAYVAAPTKKAALAAWGAKKDLFAQGSAELVTDAALSATPLAAPGTVVKVSRGTTAEQIAALPGQAPKARKAAPTPEKPPKPARPPKPKPSRDALHTAERAIKDAEQHHVAELRDIAEREAAQAKERRALTAEQSRTMAVLAEQRDADRAAYDAALRRWRG